MRCELAAVLVLSACLCAGPAPAGATDDPPGDGASAPDTTMPSRADLNRVLSVLQLRSDAASAPCLDAMKQVHATELQVADQIAHRSKPASADSDPVPDPDLDVARDVLDSDYEAATRACGTDAAHVCAGDVTATLARACSSLKTGAAPAG